MARTLAFRSALARDAVRADARASEGSYWWSDAASCPALPTGQEAGQGVGRRKGEGIGQSAGQRAGQAVGLRGRAAARIAYRRDEPTARALAERLVALAGIGPGGARDTSLAVLAPALARAGARATAVGLAPDEFESALRAGSELAFIVSLPRRSLAPCGAIGRLIVSAPWLAADSPPRDLASAMVPLVDTRLQAVVRRDRLGLGVAWDGTVTIARHARSGDGARP
jgi:hypothetical protein